jgi:hypothetical protein
LRDFTTGSDGSGGLSVPPSDTPGFELRVLVLKFQAKAASASCEREQEPMRRRTFRLGCCALSVGNRRHVAHVYHNRTHCARHRDAYITSEEMLARMKSHAGIRKLEKSEATEIARTIVDEAQPQGEMIAILQRAEHRLEKIKALPLVDEIRELIEKVRNTEMTSARHT